MLLMVGTQAVMRAPGTQPLAAHQHPTVYVQSNVHDLARGLSRALGESFSSNPDDIGPTEP